MWTYSFVQLREPRAFTTRQRYSDIPRHYVPRTLGLSQRRDLSRLAEIMASTVRLKGPKHNPITRQQDASSFLEGIESSTATLDIDGRTLTTIFYLLLRPPPKLNRLENRLGSGTGAPATLYRPMITTVSNTPANPFVCSHSSCVDKHTRRRRSFRRRPQHRFLVGRQFYTGKGA